MGKEKYTKATTKDFTLVTDFSRLRGHIVHVEGWSRGSQFRYWKTVNGVHHLRTPVSKRRYTTMNRLLLPRKG